MSVAVNELAVAYLSLSNLRQVGHVGLIPGLTDALAEPQLVNLFRPVPMERR